MRHTKEIEMQIDTEYNVRFIYTPKKSLTTQQQSDIETNLNLADIFVYMSHVDAGQACAVCDLVDQGQEEHEAKALFIKAVQKGLGQ